MPQRAEHPMPSGVCVERDDVHGRAIHSGGMVEFNCRCSTLTFLRARAISRTIVYPLKGKVIQPSQAIKLCIAKKTGPPCAFFELQTIWKVEFTGLSLRQRHSEGDKENRCVKGRLCAAMTMRR